MLKEKSIGGSGHVYLVAPSGEILVHHKKDLAPPNDVSGLYSTQRIFEGYRGIITAEDETGEILMRKVYMPLKDTNLGLVVEVPTSEVFSPILRLQKTVLPVLIVGLALLSLGGYMLIRRITGPIEELTGISNKMSSGNLNVKAEIKSNDEIGELANSFNQMAADLKEYSQGLERKVDERTKELEKAFKELGSSRTALEEAYQELKKSNELKDLFTDILRHDLLNPIGIIANLVEFMEEDKNVEDVSEFVVIKRNIKKLKDIIRNASDYAKLESAEMEIEELDLVEIMTKVIDDFEPYIESKAMKVEFKKQGKQKTNASPMLESVFANILSNSIKYSPGGTEIKIAIEDAGKNWKISFADRGEGILDEHKEKIFDRFTRKDKSGVRGTGLGLAIVKRIVEMHKGEVWAENNPGGGSIFIVEIPK